MNSVAPLLNEILGPDGTAKVVAFSLDNGILEKVREALPEADVRSGDIRAAIQYMSQLEPADILIVELSEVESPDAAVRALRSVCQDTTRVLALGTVNDVSFYRSLVSAGADDYLVLPASPDAIYRAVEHVAMERGKTGENAYQAKKVFVTGSRGGAGVSTFVTGAAWHLAEKCGLKVVVVDLDLSLGTTALSFDIEPSHGLREVLENPERVDGLFISSALAQVTDRLCVLAAEEDLSDPPTIRPGAMDLLMGELEKSHDCIIIDAPIKVLAMEPRLLMRADYFAVISEMNLAGIRDILRINDLVGKEETETNFSVIAGKASVRDKGEVARKEFARGISMPVTHSLPFDAQSVANAAKNGRAVTDIANKSELSKEIVKIAEEFCQDRLKRQARGGFLQRFKRKG